MSRSDLAVAAVLFLFTSFLPSARAANVARLEPVVIDIRKHGLETVASIYYEPAWRKVYVGTRSRDPERRGLLVFDVTADGAVARKPRRYRDHPAPLPKDHWSLVRCMYVDAKVRKLYMGIGGSPTIPDNLFVIYALDDKGEPEGAPTAFPTGNPHKVCETIIKHPRLPRLYLAGWGGSDVYTYDLDEDGLPADAPLTHAVGGYGKTTIGMRSDGGKLYMGTYPGVVQIVNLDPEGNAAGEIRSYAVPDGKSLGYLRITVLDRGVYFRSATGRLARFALDASGEPKGEPIETEALRVQSVERSAVAGRLMVTLDSGFKDAFTGDWIVDGLETQEVALGPDGRPGKVVARSRALARRKTEILSSRPAPALAVAPLAHGFLGNRFSGLRARVMLTGLKADGILTPASSATTLNPKAVYLCFAYSPRHQMVYATGENIITSIPVADGGPGKAVSISCSGADVAIVVDKEGGRLYVAKTDGSVAIRALGDNGLPAKTGDDVVVGIKPIRALIVNPKTDTVYAVGPANPAAEIDTADLAARQIVPVAAGHHTANGIVHPSGSRLYTCSAYNGNSNLWVWRLGADGALESAEATQYADGIAPGKATGRGIVSTLRLDAERRRLYLAGNLEKTAPGEGAVMVYGLDENNDPAGEPQRFASGNTQGVVGALEIAPQTGWLYEGGWGDTNVYAHRLDAKGLLTGEAIPMPVGGQGKSQITLSGDGKCLLLGTYPSVLETIALERNGRAVGGARASLGQTDLGILVVGTPSQWVNLDEVLKNKFGVELVRLTLKGTAIRHAKVRFETALADGDRLKRLRTASITIAGNIAALFVPRYGQDTLDGLADMVETSAERYEKYRSWAEKHAVQAADRPRRFVVEDGLIGIDSSPEALEAGVKTLAALGYNSAQIWNFPGIAGERVHTLAFANGIMGFRYAVYNPPSYFDYNVDKVQPAFLDEWAKKFMDSSSNTMGATRDEMRLFHLADEPGWYYPWQIEDVKAEPSRLAVFRETLKSKGLTPAFFGRKRWEDVLPLQLSDATTLENRRLFYWTIRFFAESFGRGMAAANAALLRQMNPRLLVATNLNNWPGRHYIPSPGKKIANNSDTSLDAGMGMPDWFELGRTKAISCIWTEDWFGDSEAQKWSMYADLLRCAAREGGIKYGAYVVGHCIGGYRMRDGATYKVMSLVGHGAKGLEFYVFGPNPAFGDGWSEYEPRYKDIADAIRTLGRGEELLYPGKPRHGTVAILLPQASQIWDPDAAGRFYLNELYGLYAALIHENYPVDFVDDYGIEAGHLRTYGYSALYVTAPNLSIKAQRAILDWTKAGGTLALLPGACAADEYNEPTDLVAKRMGCRRNAVEREAQPRSWTMSRETLHRITVVGEDVGTAADGTKYQIAPLTVTNGKTLAEFADGKEALVAAASGRGRIVSFGYWPGVTYWESPNRGNRSVLPQNWAENTRRMITVAARLARAVKYVTVSEDLVEGVLLESDRGVAVTLLNWSGRPIGKLSVAVTDLGRPAAVASLEQGRLDHKSTAKGVQFSLPLETVDVVMITR